MTLPDFEPLPGDDPNSQTEPNAVPRANPVQSDRRPPRRVVHRPMAARRPVEQERKPARLFSLFSRLRKALPAVEQQAEEIVPLTPEGGWEAFPGFDLEDFDIKPGLKQREFEASSQAARAQNLTGRLRPDRTQKRRTLWDIAGVLSLLINAILVVLLVLMAGKVRGLQASLEDLMQSLYGNFAALDDASIATTLTVDAQVPLNFVLPVSQNTNIQLTQAVTLSATRVRIDTGTFTIDAPARITLPEGTLLPIALAMDIPVQAVIPLSLQVPLNIPLNQTQLHGPLEGLQQTILPLTCRFDQNAQYPEGVFICAEQDAAPIVPGQP